MTNMPPPYAYLHLDTATEKWTVHDEPGPMRVAVWTKNLIESAQPAPGVVGDWDSQAYASMADELESWKQRALAAEADVTRMCDEFNAENGPTHMGEPVLSPRPAESVDEEMTRLMEIHGVSDLPALVRMLLRFNENLRSRQMPDPQIPQRAPREG